MYGELVVVELVECCDLLCGECWCGEFWVMCEYEVDVFGCGCCKCDC